MLLARTELSRLQERIRQLQEEKIQQKYLYCEDRQQQVRLVDDCEDMDAKIQGKSHMGQHLKVT